MAYRVEIARNAEAELEELYLWVVQRAPQQGASWFNGLERAILSLDQHPKRYPEAPESIDPDQPGSRAELRAEASRIPGLLHRRRRHQCRARGSRAAWREATAHTRRTL